MPYTINGKNSMLANLGATHVSAHTEDPGNSGAFELQIGVYSRELISFDDPVNGVINSTIISTITIPAGRTINFIGFWDAQSGGNLKAYKQITAQIYEVNGTLAVTDADLDLNLQ